MAIEEDFRKSTETYWNSIASSYSQSVSITTEDFHYGPLVPGDSELGLLPEVKGRRCLELGCGGAQNSIFLAKKGAECHALDISEKQLESAASLAQKEDVRINLLCSSMEDAEKEKLGKFFLIHSSYALSFSANPKEIIKKCFSLLESDGKLIFSTGHPLFSGEWLDIGGEQGLFIKDYFNPVPDSRFDKDGRETVRSSFFPVSETSNWLSDAGFVIERILEPEPLPLDEMSKEEIIRKVPYYSKGWHGLYDQIIHIPPVIIFKARPASITINT